MVTRAREIEIEKAVIDLLEDYSLASYPISISRVLKTLQVDLVPYSNLEEEEKQLALLASRDKAFNITSHDYIRAQVVLDDTRGSYFYRSRFSGSHETGHIWLGHDRNMPSYEVEANYFAGYLLAPHPLILTMKRQTSPEVADRFGISEPCASYAIDQANIRRREGGPWRPHEQWLLNHVQWEGGGLLASA